MTLNTSDTGLTKDELMEFDQTWDLYLSDSSDITESFTNLGEEDENYKQTEGKPSGLFGFSRHWKLSPYSFERNIQSDKQIKLDDEIKLLNKKNCVHVRENKWYKKWIKCLLVKENANSQNQLETKAPKECLEKKEKELDPLRSSSTIEITVTSKPTKKCKSKKLRHKSDIENSVSEKSNIFVPVQQGNKVNLQDSKTSEKNEAGTEEQNSLYVSERNKKKNLKQVALQAQKKSFLEAIRTEEKIEYKYIKDILSLLGEINKNLPSLSEDSDKIWKGANAQGYSR